MVLRKCVISFCHHIYSYISKISRGRYCDNTLFNFGFWPGGDRTETLLSLQKTPKTAERLKYTIQRNYYRDLRRLKRKILLIRSMKKLLLWKWNVHYFTLSRKGELISLEKLSNELAEMEYILIEEHQGIILTRLETYLTKLWLSFCFFRHPSRFGFTRGF